MYEYKKGDEVTTMYSVAYITRPRTKEANACLCFTLMSGVPKKKPCKRDPDVRDPSGSVVLDLQENSEWQMDSTLKMALFDPAKSQDDGMQVQCLPVYKAETPQWTYRKVREVTSFRDYGSILVGVGSHKRLCSNCVLRTSQTVCLFLNYLMLRGSC